MFDALIALAILALFCLYGSGDRTGPYESRYYDNDDDWLDD